MALRTIPGAQIADEPVIGYSSRRNDIRWDSQHHFRMVGGAGHGGGMTDFDIVLVTPFSQFAQLRFARIGRANPDLGPEDLFNQQIDTVLDDKHRDKSMKLPAQEGNQGTFCPLVFSAGGSMGLETWDAIRKWKKDVGPGAFASMIGRMSVALVRARARTFRLATHAQPTSSLAYHVHSLIPMY